MLPQPNNSNSAGLADKKTLLRSHPFFTGLDGQIVERLVPYALTRKVKRGTLLFRKGDALTPIQPSPTLLLLRHQSQNES